MCELTITPDEEKVNCSHCGEVANPDDAWEYGWPMYGKITIGIDCCSLNYLWPDGYREKGMGFNHPAMVASGFQEINFEWGNGYKFDSTGKYRLCWDCQRKLMKLIGSFFADDVVYKKTLNPKVGVKDDDG